MTYHVNNTYAKLAPESILNKKIKEIMRYTRGTPDIPFSSKLRWRYIRFKAEQNGPQTIEIPQNSENTTEEIERTAPWTKISILKKPPPPTDNAALESFINCLEKTIINPNYCIPNKIRIEC